MAMSRIFWDTNLFIYLFEDYGPFSQRVAELRRRMLLRGDQLLTSALTLGEILVKPLEKGDRELCMNYKRTLAQISVVVPFDTTAAETYASVRADRSIRAPDAVQLSCAAAAGTDVFITNDRRLQGKHIPGIQFVVPLDQAPL
jgi:predicted nucleic acid-binding protein